MYHPDLFPQDDAGDLYPVDHHLTADFPPRDADGERWREALVQRMLGESGAAAGFLLFLAAILFALIGFGDGWHAGAPV